MDLDFRPGTPDDGSILLSIHRRAVTKVAAQDYPPDLIQSWLHGLTPEGYGRSMAEGERIELALVDGRPAGFCGVIRCEVRGLFVDPAYARRGLGSTLLQRALQDLRSLGCARVAVISSVTGIPFYVHNGFNELQRRMHRSRGGLDMEVVDMMREFT
jgi:GNAT superfamily N-acetyltransferase